MHSLDAPVRFSTHALARYQQRTSNPVVDEDALLRDGRVEASSAKVGRKGTLSLIGGSQPVLRYADVAFALSPGLDFGVEPVWIATTCVLVTPKHNTPACQRKAVARAARAERDLDLEERRLLA